MVEISLLFVTLSFSFYIKTLNGLINREFDSVFTG